VADGEADRTGAGLDERKTVFVLGDREHVRERLVVAAAVDARLRLCGSARIDPDGVAAAAGCRPDLVALDTGGRNWRAAARLLRETCPSIAIVGFSRAFDAAAAGEMQLAGFASGPFRASAVLSALAEAADGSLRMSPRIEAATLSALARSGGTSPLTAREGEVVELTHGGLSARQIARRLGMSLATVEDHLAKAAGKALESPPKGGA